MKTIGIALLAALSAAMPCGAWAKHYSFSNGCPANDAANSGSANAVEHGGASMATTAKAQTRVANAEKTFVGRVKSR